MMMTMLATVGLKFLAFIPILLTKIIVLAGLNFVASNLNLLLTTVFGFKSFMKKGLEDQMAQPEVSAHDLTTNPLLHPSFRYELMP